MEIVKERSGDFLNVRVTGRLDNHWSEPFDEAIAEMIRQGAHHLRLDLSAVNYLSSAGIGVLMKAYRDTNELHGSFRISAASDRVRTVLRLVELESLLFVSAADEPVPLPVDDLPRPIQSETALFEVHVLGEQSSEARLLGDPARMSREGYAPEDTSSISIGEKVFALGVGALGTSYTDSHKLFGEFIAAAGSAAYMPTDGTSTPDYMMSSGILVPEIQAAYAIEFRGAPSHLLRFEASETGRPVPLSEIVGICAAVAGTPEFGLVMAAEVSGLVCTMLRRSPAQADPSRFDFPAVRQWLSFTPEREYARTSSIVVGLATASPAAALRPFVRPISEQLDGHFHAAVTAFRSLSRGKVDLGEVLAQSFQPRSLLSVVHLLRDSRAIEGAGESEFQRGACWLFPLTKIQTGDAS